MIILRDRIRFSIGESPDLLIGRVIQENDPVHEAGGSILRRGGARDGSAIDEDRTERIELERAERKKSKEQLAHTSSVDPTMPQTTETRGGMRSRHWRVATRACLGAVICVTRRIRICSSPTEGSHFLAGAPRFPASAINIGFNQLKP